MGYPQRMHVKPTGPTQLIPYYSHPDENDTIITLKDMQPFPLNEITPLAINCDIIANYPLYHRDDRVIVWELKRGFVGDDTSYEFYRKNRYVVPYSPPLSAVLGSNTAAYLLGSEEQAKGAEYYIMDYMTKNKTALANIVPLMHEALMHTKKYKSKAEDSNSIERKATHFLTTMNNKLSTMSEVSAVMASAALLGLKSSVCSHQFTYIYILPAIDFVKNQQKTINRGLL
jgi:hypothetical protein